jgi:hypothetical protein
LEITTPRGRPRNRWQDKVRKDGRIAGGEVWQEKVYNREEYKKLLRTARNRRILHVPVECNRINTSILNATHHELLNVRKLKTTAEYLHYTIFTIMRSSRPYKVKANIISTLKTE